MTSSIRRTRIGSWCAGRSPRSLPRGKSLAGYLNEVSFEEGLIAEMDFRRPPFPEHDGVARRRPPDPALSATRRSSATRLPSFDAIFRFYELPFFVRRRGAAFRSQAQCRGDGGGNTSIFADPRSGTVARAFHTRTHEALQRGVRGIAGKSSATPPSEDVRRRARFNPIRARHPASFGSGLDRRPSAVRPS